GIVLAEVREQERAAAARVLGVAAHHLEPRALDLVLALGLHLGGSDRGRNVESAGPSHLAVHLPDCGSQIDQTDERAGQPPRRPSRTIEERLHRLAPLTRGQSGVVEDDALANAQDVPRRLRVGVGRGVDDSRAVELGRATLELAMLLLDRPYTASGELDVRPVEV